MAAAGVCVIFNPTAGRRRLAEHLERFHREFGNGFEPLPTRCAGHAEELAYEAVQAGFEMVAAAGGDGTVHEVANGLLRASQVRIADCGLGIEEGGDSNSPSAICPPPSAVLRVLPIGSANDYAYSLSRMDPPEFGTRNAECGINAGVPHSAFRIPHFPGQVRRVDVGLARRSDGRQRYFVNGLGLGFNGNVTVEARKIRHLRGLPLYCLALLRTLCYQFHSPPMTVAFDGTERRVPTLALTVNIGQREGNFVTAPDARLDDGLFDYLHAGSLKRWELLRFLPAIITGRLPTGHPQIWRGRCRQVSVHSEAPLTVHLDGELFCVPKDGIDRIDVEILPAALPVLTPAAGRG